MDNKKIIKRLREIRDGIDGDRYTMENIDQLIKELSE